MIELNAHQSALLTDLALCVNRWRLYRERRVSPRQLRLRYWNPMGWINDARKELLSGRELQVRPFGGSMRGRIESGQLVTLKPVAADMIQVDDVVLVEWKGNFILHLVKEIRNEQMLIGNNLGKVNGWVPMSAVLGKVTAIGDIAPP